MPLLTMPVLARAEEGDHLPESQLVALDGCDRPTDVARAAVRRALDGRTAPDRIDDAVLVADELIVNAVQHTPGPASLVIHLHREYVQLWVYDQSPDCAVVCSRDAAHTDLDGRGLLLVGELSTTWFVLPTVDGKAVVAVVLLSSR